jgi:hypothetical protein
MTSIDLTYLAAMKEIGPLVASYLENPITDKIYLENITKKWTLGSTL